MDQQIPEMGFTDIGNLALDSEKFFRVRAKFIEELQTTGEADRKAVVYSVSLAGCCAFCNECMGRIDV